MTDFVFGKTYVVSSDVMVCLEDENMCALEDMIELKPGTQLKFVGVDDDSYRFNNGDGSVYRLHKNDLGSVEELR